jgi:hypothetical protein
MAIMTLFVFYIRFLRLFFQCFLKFSFCDICQDHALLLNCVTVSEWEVVDSINQLGFFICGICHLFFKHQHVVGFDKSSLFQLFILLFMLSFLVHSFFLSEELLVFFFSPNSFLKLIFLFLNLVLVYNLS